MLIQLNQFTTQWHLRRDRFSNQRERLSQSKKTKAVGIMKTETKELDNKVKVLKLKIAKTEEIIHKRDREALERLRLSISSLARVVDDYKLKIDKGEGEKEIALWGEEMNDTRKRPHLNRDSKIISGGETNKVIDHEI